MNKTTQSQPEINFPIFRAGTCFNDFKGTLNGGVLSSDLCLVKEHVKIKFPTRINAMSFNLPGLAPNKQMIFPAGEVLISIDKTVTVETEYLGDFNGQIKLGEHIQRKALVIHAYHLMCKAIGKTPSLYIDADDRGIIKHSGLGLSGAIIGAVCCSINELFGNPISDLDLIKYITSNYGEEVSDTDVEFLQSERAIGGSIATGLFSGGIQVIAGHATPIMKSNYHGKAIIAVPTDFMTRTAKDETAIEEEYAHTSMEVDGDNSVYSPYYSEKVSFRVLNELLPQLVMNDFTALGELSFNFCFNPGGVKLYNLLYPRANEIANNVRHLYEHSRCDALGISSTGPAFYALVSNEGDERFCVKTFEDQQMNVSTVSIYNGKYELYV